MDVQTALSTLKDETNGDKALEFLYIASYFSPDEIEINLFTDLLGDKESLSNAVKLMKERSLLQHADEPTCILIRNEVREEVQKILKKQDKEEAVLKAAINFLNKCMVSERFAILDHAMSVFNAAKGYPRLLKKTSKFPIHIIGGLMALNRHSEAQAFSRQALKIFETSIGAYHQSTYAVRKLLGNSLVKMKRVDEGLMILSEAYQKFSEAFACKTIDETFELIAEATSSMTSKPECCLRRLLFGDVSVSETNNNSELHMWCEYAMILIPLRWTDEALPILQQVLEKRCQMLSPDDDEICNVEAFIGLAHMKRREYREAVEIFQRIYTKRKCTLGENCIMTHRSRRSLGFAYECFGMLDEALVEYEAAAEGMRRILGDESFSYLATLSKVAYTLFRQEKYERAYDIYSDLYDDFVRILEERNLQIVDIKYDVHALSGQNKTEAVLLPQHVEIKDSSDLDVAQLVQHMCILTLYRNILPN